MKIPIYKGSVDNKDDEVRLSCSDVKICDRVEVENNQKVLKPKHLKRGRTAMAAFPCQARYIEKGALQNGRFPLSSK